MKLQKISITNTWIEILDESFHEEALYSYKQVKSLGWDFDFDFEIITLSPDNFHIKVYIDYWLDAIDDDKEGVPVLNISLCTNFHITCEIDLEGKLETMEKLFLIAYWNLQGVYIARTQGTGFANEIPPIINFEEYKDQTLNKIENEWK